jgi:hypothetical protein
MVSLKWGDALSMLLPGSVALLAIQSYFPMLNELFTDHQRVGSIAGAQLLFAAALSGGVLEALTKIAWEPLWLQRKCPAPNPWRGLSSENLALYEAGFQTLYRWVTFYANLAWATTFLLVSRLFTAPAPTRMGTLLLAGVIVVALRASYVHWTSYVTYLERLFPSASPITTPN